jgi:hypothetical protein
VRASKVGSCFDIYERDKTFLIAELGGADVKSRLDEVLRRGSVSVKPALGRLGVPGWSCRGANVGECRDLGGRARSVLKTCVFVLVKTGQKAAVRRLRSTQRQLEGSECQVPSR